MTTLALTAKEEIPAVLLEIAAAPAGPVTILRTDANGTAEVRLLPDQEPSGGILIAYDYEAALLGTISYEVIDSAAASTVATVTLTAMFPHIHAARLPHAGLSVTNVTGFDSDREPSGEVHWPIFSDSPIIIGGELRLRNGTMTVFCGSFEDAHALDQVMRLGEVCQLRQAQFAGFDLYFTPRGSRVSPLEGDTSPRRWQVAIPYQEDVSPVGPLLSAAGWTIADVVAAFPTIADVTASFATIAELTIGP